MTDPSPEEFEFVGPSDEGWYRTQIPDWIALCPQVTHTAYRLYAIVRSLILEKQPKKVRLLSDEQLAFLLPGPNGKPSGVRTVKDALKVLTDVGLVSNPDGERIVTSRGKGSISTRRRYQLHDWPTAKVAMTVWRNTFDKLDAYTEDWRETRTDVFPGQYVVQDSAPRTDQGNDADSSGSDATPQGDVSAGQFVVRNSAGAVRDSAEAVRDSVRNADTTSNDASPLKQFPEGVSSSSGSTSKTPVPRPSEEEEDVPSARDNPASEDPARDDVIARTDATAEEADAVIDSIEDHAERNDISIGSIERYVAGFGVRDLRRHLKGVRAQRASESRTEASGGRGALTCGLHQDRTVPCPMCRAEVRDPEMHEELRHLLRTQGADNRPDLVALLSALN